MENVRWRFTCIREIKQGPSNHLGEEEGGRIHNCNNVVQGEVLLYSYAPHLLQMHKQQQNT